MHINSLPASHRELDSVPGPAKNIVNTLFELNKSYNSTLGGFNEGFVHGSDGRCLKSGRWS